MYACGEITELVVLIILDCPQQQQHLGSNAGNNSGSNSDQYSTPSSLLQVTSNCSPQSQQVWLSTQFFFDLGFKAYPHHSAQLSNLWWMPNSVSISFGPAMKMSSSWRFKRYLTNCMLVSSWLPFTVDFAYPGLSWSTVKGSRLETHI